MRVVRIYHAGRDAAHRARERALVAEGVHLRLIVPSSWPGPDDPWLDEPFDVVALDVVRPGDVNRHRYASMAALGEAIASWRPDVLDVHEEPYSLVANQVLKVAQDVPVVMYSAQNLDKRWPPPFSWILRRSYARVGGFYPCSRQAASVLRGSGYSGPILPLPLGIEPTVHRPGPQDIAGDPVLVLGFVGRLVPEKGLLDALEVTSRLSVMRPTRLVVVGSGPDEPTGRALALRKGLDVHWHPWLSAEAVADLYRSMHIVLVPSRTTTRWVEQFGRVITEGAANGAVPVGYSGGSIPEVIGDLGSVVPEGDVAGLLAEVERLQNMPEEWLDLRAAGLRRSAKLSWSSVAQSMVRVYRIAGGASTRKVAADRAAARCEFGLPSRTSMSDRPMALPVLRDSPALHRVLDRLVP